MLHTLHILAVKPNQTHLLSLREKRDHFYRRFGMSSALVFEPVIPISVCCMEAEGASAAPGDTPYRKELFIGFSRGGKNGETSGTCGGQKGDVKEGAGKGGAGSKDGGKNNRKKGEKKRADSPPVLSFSSLERYKNTYYYPLNSTRIWDTFNRVLENEGVYNSEAAIFPPAAQIPGPQTPEAQSIGVQSPGSQTPEAQSRETQSRGAGRRKVDSPAPPFLCIPPFPGIFAAAAEEGAADSDRREIGEGGPERTGPAFDKSPEFDKDPEFDKTVSAPEPWRNYKLALFELQGQIGNNGKWWDGCSWYEVWELTLGCFS